MTQVVITGIGIVSPLGTGVEAFWDALMTGRSGARSIEAFDASALPVRIACEVPDFDPSAYVSPREASRMDRYAQMAVAAAGFAWDVARCSELQDPQRIGVIVGSGIGGLSTIEREHAAFLEGGARRVSPFMVPKLMPNAAAGAIAMKFRVFGPNFAPTSACATGAHAVGEAYRYIKHGLCDAMLTGGSEAAITPLTVSAFARMGALSRRNDEPELASRPFDADRDGFVCAEGACVLVLESKEAAERRGVQALAEIVGYGASADAHHVTQPDPEGHGASLAMRAALADAGATPDMVDYVNAHGTSTPFNDRVETIALKDTLGVEAKRVPVSSTKSQTGHMLGAAGAIEAAVTTLAIDKGVVPSTINLTHPDPECDLDYVAEGPREHEVRFALSNSFGFGGQNACLALRAV
ncbi:MAG: beta-ketoacyl-ACP synthase II [Actinomycetota bacterium]